MREIIGISLSSNNKCARNTNHTVGTQPPSLETWGWIRGQGSEGRTHAGLGGAVFLEEASVPRHIAPPLPSVCLSSSAIQLSSPGAAGKRASPLHLPLLLPPGTGLRWDAVRVPAKAV